MHDRRDGIEEGELRLAGDRADVFRERGRSEGAGRDDDAVPVGGRHRDFAARERDERMVFERLRHGGGEAVAVDGKRTARGHLVGVAAAHDQGAEPAHLLVQQAHRIMLRIVRAEGVGADELGIAVGLVRVGHLKRPHLVQHNRDPGLRELPRGFGTGEAAADDVNGFQGHGRKLGAGSGRGNAPKTKPPASGAGGCDGLESGALSPGGRRSRQHAGCPSG
jgi:hypothetical protein